MVRADQNDGSRCTFHDGDMQEMRWSAFNRRLLYPSMCPYSFGKKRGADFMEPHTWLQDEPLQHLRLRHVVNTFNFYFADFEPTLKNRSHLSSSHGQPPSQQRQTDDPLPHTPRTSFSRGESLLPRPFPLF